MHTKTNGPDEDRLYMMAESQAGYFTTRQAEQAGYSRPLLGYHTSTRTFERVRPGVYRFSRYPSSPREDLYAAWLEAGSRAVVSHESALELYGLSDVLPSETHLTLPRSSSRRRTGIRMHTSRLEEGDVTVRDGLPVTSVPRTIADISRQGGAEDTVEQAVREALDRGLTTEADLERQAVVRGGRARVLISAALRRWRDQ